MPRINFNDTVYCALTPFGRERTKLPPSVNLDRLPVDGIQLWELLESFGCDQMYNGAQPIVEGNVFEWRGDTAATSPRGVDDINVKVPPKPGTDNYAVEIMSEDSGFVFVTVVPVDEAEGEASIVSIVAIEDLRRALGPQPDKRVIGQALAADLTTCLNALRKTSTDPVACALAQRLVAELSIAHVDGE